MRVPKSVSMMVGAMVTVPIVPHTMGTVMDAGTMATIMYMVASSVETEAVAAEIDRGAICSVERKKQGMSPLI